MSVHYSKLFRHPTGAEVVIKSQLEGIPLLTIVSKIKINQEVFSIAAQIRFAIKELMCSRSQLEIFLDGIKKSRVL